MAPVVAKKKSREPSHNDVNKLNQKLDPGERQKTQLTAKSARLLFMDDGDRLGAIRMLAEAFVGLDDADGLDPWDPVTFAAWGEARPTRDVQLSVLFLLSVAQPREIVFPLQEAIDKWDELSRVAFATWVNRPWALWPE